ncbi:glycosyl transferase family 1 [Knoellia sinensis KCTC 19936]|uniref:Glycosyl transferase family 1 n=1 Tax=Knoellia sinensis KCTC 19936 TaxID=1385520 RepID=A0A0A0J5T1_9MICO|nr:glycosyltransferase family 4 protein [Knoellia sinensis]KGN32543.1 glycosyl transferase family 1 [Knoellia sinensis KCTC 19936]
MPLRILMLNWRDMEHPEAGGAEKYLVTVARGLAAKGHRVIFRTAAYPGGLPHEVVDGVHYVRKGGRFDIYARSVVSHLIKKYDVDVVVDVQNGVPYLSPLTWRGPVVNLVHHVHKEQWPVLFGPRLSHAGWWLESKLAPLVYRRTPYVAVSESTRRELGGLGIAPDRIEVIHNGTDAVPLDDTPRSLNPSLIVLGRLVPQKRVEIAMRAVAELSHDYPDITLDVVGSGWSLPHLEDIARDLGVEKHVTFHGHVSEEEKHELLARAWVHAMPSLKEGWGLVVVEAGVHGTPTVAFTEAGGPTDSIVHDRTGLLVDGGQSEFTAAIRSLLDDDELRERMSAEVSTWVRQFHWDETVEKWERLLLDVVAESHDVVAESLNASSRS